ncbi:MAG: hypothetical protein ACXAEU_24775, partial [Candidatus Hodarchaeales archaeon]
MELERLIIGIILATLAGLLTPIGALMIIFIRNPSQRLVSVAMGFSAGVMIAVSIFELLPEALNSLDLFTTSALFIFGMVAIMLIDFIIPHKYKMESQAYKEKTDITDGHVQRQNSRLMRTSTLIAIGIAIHKFPEGFLVLTGSLESLNLGLIMA